MLGAIASRCKPSRCKPPRRKPPRRKPSRRTGKPPRRKPSRRKHSTIRPFDHHRPRTSLPSLLRSSEHHSGPGLRIHTRLRTPDAVTANAPRNPYFTSAANSSHPGAGGPARSRETATSLRGASWTCGCGQGCRGMYTSKDCATARRQRHGSHFDVLRATGLFG